MSEKESREFFSLFDNSPNTAIYHLSNNCNDIVKLVEQLTNNINAELSSQKLDAIEPKRLRLKDRNFEYAIISDCLDKIEDQDRFITTLYHSLENSAYIIILQTKDSIDIETIKEILDKNHFRAANDINIFKNYNLVMAKKLHMWGAGQ